MTEPTADEIARWAGEHRRFALPDGSEWCAECDVEWPCMTARLLALVAAQADQIAVVQSRLLSAELDAGLVIEASRDRADEAEAKIARVRALCDRYRANCDPTSRQAEVAELFRAALDGTEGDA